MNTLFKKNILKLMDLNYKEINYILKLAKDLKIQKNNKTEIKQLINKKIILIFEKQSTRTRCSFEVAAFDQGAHITYLEYSNNQINYKESIKDTARILNNLYDAIQYRGYEQQNIENLAKYTSIPIWNGLTNEFHPTQVLADLMTIKEYLPEKKFNEIKLAYIGNADNNVSNSLIEAAAVTGLNLNIIAPKKFWPNEILIEKCKKLKINNKNNILITENIDIGIKNMDFIYTDVWVSMGEKQSIWKERIDLLHPYQVNMNLLDKNNNPNVKFMHCLPAFHDCETKLGKQIISKYQLSGGIEVTNEVFESSYSIVFNQASNRLHTIKAIMIATLKNLE